ncbi:hypothetical protein C2G38_2208503 [Gigaspora rosea]|uniref:Integrase zinc-binding domain-containing protein n=1 Tax=Gigaspora rosea TaxID=44941 RepID=A0A397UHK7_9GLOM|nr:hypothetical protein C2G38_2208503 [Gigaspora rosea]
MILKAESEERKTKGKKSEEEYILNIREISESYNQSNAIKHFEHNWDATERLIAEVSNGDGCNDLTCKLDLNVEMYRDTREYVRTCEQCQRQGMSQRKEPLYPIKVEQTFEQIGIDLVGPLPIIAQKN